MADQNTAIEDTQTELSSATEKLKIDDQNGNDPAKTDKVKGKIQVHSYHSSHTLKVRPKCHNP